MKKTIKNRMKMKLRGGNDKKKTKKVKRVFKIVEEFENEPKDLKTPLEKIHMKERMNEKYIELMEKLSNIMLKQGEPFRARAYQKAEETIMSYEGDIQSPEQLKGLPAIGPTIMEKLTEYTNTGTLHVLEREKANPINLLAEIYGVGPKKAKEVVDMGITTIEQLREKQDLVLNDTQKTGLHYFEDIQLRIPRDEIDKYSETFTTEFSKVSTPNSRFEIVGSYRRGLQSSGDIDVIITSNDSSVFRNFIDELIKNKIILVVLSRGNTKCLVIAKLPNFSHARRVDFLYTSPQEYPFSVLYFTGSKIFNTVMRGRAQTLGYSLNEHGIYKMQGKKKEDKVNNEFHSEEDIFQFLGMVYKSPQERIDGRAVVINTKEVEQLIPTSQPVIPVTTLKKVKTNTSTKKLKVVVEVDEDKKQMKTKKLKKTLKLQESSPQEVEDTAVLNKEPIENTLSIQLINDFKKNGIQTLESLTEEQLTSMIVEANNAYHFVKKPIMTDNQYDILREYLEKKYPDNYVLKEVGAPIVEKNKVTLPFEMASMNKIKPDTNALTNWKQKFDGPYVLSCKMDGVSGMYVVDGNSKKLYTRGNGKVGQDVTHLIPYLHLPSGNNIVVRGEFVIPKSIFKEKYSSIFANPRNLVAGIVNRQVLDDKVNDLHFVAYEVIIPSLKPSAQMQLLAQKGFETVLNETTNDLTNELLSEKLVQWRSDYLYEIDGIIVTDDKVHPRTSGNPDHSFAFKMVLSDQIAEAKVVDVLWSPSKDGYLKPRVQIEPIQLGGVRIEYATGFNAAFIEQNKIGVGALIQIIRSGDVIPHIQSVTTPADQAKMPSVPFKWNDSHVDIILEDASTDVTVREKNITGFFRGIGVEGLSGGNVSRIITAGFDSVPAIIHMSKNDFLKVEGFKDKLATKIYEGIREKVKQASLITLVSASNIFGRGFSDKKVELILNEYPDILTSNESNEEKVKKIADIKGMALKTAEAFVAKMNEFIQFLQDCGLQSKLNGNNDNSSNQIEIDTFHPLYKKTVVMTGVRDPIIIESLKKVGANLGTSVSKNTFLVIAKTTDEDTGKAAEARKLNIRILTPSLFMEEYF